MTLIPFFQSLDVTIYRGDSRTMWQQLAENSVDAIVTSPPYWGLRDYGVDGQLGLEYDPTTYIRELADLLTGYGERVLKPGGSLWLNLGDTYSTGGGGRVGPQYRVDREMGGFHGGKADAWELDRPASDFPAKCLLMIPERVALALIDRDWILRNKVIWHKPNGMPTSVKDRLATKWEYVFHLVRQPRYFYDLDAIREPTRLGRPQEEWNAQDRQSYRNLQAGRIRDQGTHRAAMDGTRSRKGNRANPSPDGPGDSTLMYNPAGKNPGDVWSISTQPYPAAHFAVYPPKLIERPILATVPEGGTVLDPFGGSGTTAVMARRLGRSAVLVELSEDYCRLAAFRLTEEDRKQLI